MTVSEQPEREEFRLDTRFTDRGQGFPRKVAAGVAGALLLLIVIVTTTNFAAYLLPMDDAYLQVLVPRAADGSEALALKTLEHEIDGNTLTVYGTVGNRTDYALESIVIVIQAQDQYGFPAKTVEQPVEMPEIPGGGESPFRVVVDLEQPPAGYTLNFRLADGPKVPHIDDRINTYGLPQQ